MQSKKTNNMFIRNKTVMVIDTAVADGVEFTHKLELSGDEYGMVLTHWSPSMIELSTGKVTTFSQFGSWYLIRKDLFERRSNNQRGICGTDYMDERLGARTDVQQSIALDTIQNAWDRGAPYTGTIKRKIKECNYSSVLLANIDYLGDIVFIDEAYHPQVFSYTDNSNYRIFGRGASPWAPVKHVKNLMDEYNAGPMPKIHI